MESLTGAACAGDVTGPFRINLITASLWPSHSSPFAEIAIQSNQIKHQTGPASVYSARCTSWPRRSAGPNSPDSSQRSSAWRGCTALVKPAQSRSDGPAIKNTPIGECGLKRPPRQHGRCRHLLQRPLAGPPGESQRHARIPLPLPCESGWGRRVQKVTVTSLACANSPCELF